MFNIFRFSIIFLMIINNYSYPIKPTNNINKYRSSFKTLKSNNDIKDYILKKHRGNKNNACNNNSNDKFKSTPYLLTLDDLMSVDKTFWNYKKPAIIQLIIDSDNYNASYTYDPSNIYAPMYWSLYLNKEKSSIKNIYEKNNDLLIRCRDEILLGLILNELQPAGLVLKGDIYIKPIHKISLIKRFDQITAKWRDYILGI